MFRKIHKRFRPLTSYEKRCCVAVAKGAKLLNAKAPGWAHEVKLSDLELKSPQACVLGQLAVKNVLTTDEDDGPYSTGLTALGIDSGSAYGFDSVHYTDGELKLGLHLETLEYRLLDELWAEVIRRTRRGEKVSGRSLQAAMQ